MESKLVIGVDFGSDSVRAVLVDTENGNELSSSVFLYPRWNQGLYCNASKNIFRQHPKDYIEGLTSVIKESLKLAKPGSANRVVGISIDTTGSTPIAVNKEGVPLALLPSYEENPNAMFILWKDHSAINEADEITQLCKTWGGEDYTKFSGGIYSSEWYWSKILHTVRIDENVKNNAASWVEHCDWIPAYLTGNTDPAQMKRSRCAAGHKALWHQSWEGLPSDDFLQRLDPYLVNVKKYYSQTTHTSDTPVGTLTPEWAKSLGLSENVVVGVGAFDCHMGAVGAVVEPGSLTKVIGTSTCDIAIANPSDIGNNLIPGICGQVDGSVTPNHIGIEAGQSAFGDLYAWFTNFLEWPLKNIEILFEGKNEKEKKEVMNKVRNQMIKTITEHAEKIPAGQNKLTALDWVNGRRTPDANQHLKMAVSGIEMGTEVPAIFRALVEATSFGGKAIIERLEQEGIPVEKVVAIGGIPKKSPFVMQVCADVWQKQIEVVKSDQCCALGASMFAATVAKVYSSTEEAQAKMNSGIETSFTPNSEMVKTYEALYQNYKKLGGFIEDFSTQGNS